MAGRKPKSSGKKKGRGGKLQFRSMHMELFFRLLVVFILFSISRLLFFLLNYRYFSPAGTSELLKIFLYGMRFDLSALLIINVPFILMYTVPFRFREKRWYLLVSDVYFYAVNIFALITNYVDVVYFRFTLKRLTGDIFKYLGVGGDFDKLIPQFLHDFWYLLVICIIFSALFVFLCARFELTVAAGKGKKASVSYYFVQTLLFVVFGSLTVIGIRGGFQLRPISLITAGDYTSSKNVPLLLNTPFTIAKTIGNETLSTVNYFSSEKDLAKVYNPVHAGKKEGFRKLNVMVIILESFSREHIGRLNKDLENGHYRGFTPFMDSLIGEGVCFDGFANGKTSIQGIPAVLSGIPSLMNESFIQSNFAADHITSLASLLKPEGYTSAFFHGGTNGTMGFDAFTRGVGFDYYYGRKEYHNEKDYDGKWGIRDEEFFQYTAQGLNRLPQPFCAALFSLSSHHPYFVPAKYNGKFRKGKLPIQESVMYSDFSLGRFFHTLEKMPWFDNTLFVITADHTSEGYYPYYQTAAGQYAVPILFYRHNADLNACMDKPAQQTDILPTILGYLNYPKNYVAFGSDLFDPVQPRFSVHYISGMYGMMMDGYMFEFDGTRGTGLYDLKTDPMQKSNILQKKPEVVSRMTLFLKAYIQQYNNRLIENRMTVD
jgi:phosphoglycerol transferase MdoB-like AlkP superfamily enzyme